MNDGNNSLRERSAALSNQGQNWKSISMAGDHKKPPALFDSPMEITVNMLRGLRMVDETVVVYGAPEKSYSKKQGV